MTREEFIGRAADAMMRSQGLESPDLVEDEAIAGYVEMAEAALDAVGAWRARLYVAALAQGECAYAADCLTDNKQGACVFCGARAVLEGR